MFTVKNAKVYSNGNRTENKTFLSITHITEAVEGQEESRGKHHDSPTRLLSALNKMYRKGGAETAKYYFTSSLSWVR